MDAPQPQIGSSWPEAANTRIHLITRQMERVPLHVFLNFPSPPHMLLWDAYHGDGQHVDATRRRKTTCCYVLHLLGPWRMTLAVKGACGSVAGLSVFLPRRASE